jgi:hypothetical protein
MISASWDWNPIFGWHQMPCLGAGPFERIVNRMQLETQLRRIKAMLTLVDILEVAQAA